MSGPEKSRGRIKSEYYQVNYHCDSGVGCGDCVWASEHIGSIAVEQVALDHSSLTLKAGDAETLSATVLYSNNRTDNRVVWTTSNEAVASVDENGVVIAIAPGTTVITAQASKNNTAESAVCTITVCSEPTGYSIALSADSVCMQETFYVHITPYEDDITEIHVIARSPSGQEFDRLLSEKDTSLTLRQAYGQFMRP